MPDNLSISIGIDTAKLRADAAIVKEELRKVNAEVKAAARAQDVPRLQAAAAAQDRLIRQYGQLTQQIRTNTAATQQGTRANVESAESFRKVGIEIGHFAHAAGFGVEGLRALRLGFGAFAAVEVIRGITSAVDAINKLNIEAKEAGTTVGTIKALQTAFRAAGDDASKAAPLLSKFDKAARESRLRQQELSDERRRAYHAALDAGMSESAASEAARKTEAAPKPGEDPFGWLGVSPYARTREEQDKQSQDTARALLQRKASQPDEAAAASLKLYGQELAVIEEELQKIAAGQIKGDEPTKAQVETQKQLNAEVAQTKGLWDQVSTAIGNAAAVAATAAAAFPQVLNQNYVPPQGNAAGGYIRGPGTGTSDSIPARLSNGEFVLNAASVRRLGVGFLHGLNNFAAGGFVDIPRTRFAAGGLASIGSGSGDRSVASFHFESGSSFKLGGPVDVVNAMVNEAHHQQMRSAGVKPSWFAARPSGR